MSGRGQHFIPQHFQIPFVIQDGKDQLWLCRRDVNTPKLVARKDAAKKRDFYSPPSIDGIPTLDDLITDYESRLTNIVDEIRGMEIGESIPSMKVAEVSVHLTFRSAHLRNMLIEMVDSFVDNLSKSLKNKEELFFLVQSSLPSYSIPPNLEKLFIKGIEEIEGYKFQPISSTALSRLAYIMLREKKNNVFEDVLKSFDISQELFSSDSKSFAVGSHTELLTKEIAPKYHVNILSQLNWEVVEHAITDAILPDCVCFGIDSDGEIKPLLLLDHSKIEVVVLPLSPSSLAVGKNGDIDFDPESYNDLAFKASFDFFLTRTVVPRFVDTQSKIGGQIKTKIHAFTSNMIASKAKHLVEDVSHNKTPRIPNLIEDIQPKKDDQHSSIDFTFMSCADEDTAQLIAQKVNDVVTELLSPKITSSFLDRIIFVNNFRAALNDIDNGGSVSEAGQVSIDSNEKGITASKTIVKDGVNKSLVVINGEICSYLMSENLDNQKIAYAAISYSIISVEFIYIIKERFPKQFLKPIEDPIEGFLHFYTNGVFENYYINRIVNIKLETIEELEVELIELLDNCFLKVINKRRIYRENGNLDDFFSYAVSYFIEILVKFARLYSSLDSLSEEREISRELSRVITKYDIENWTLEYAKDLNEFYNNLNMWSDYRQIYFVNRHLERWLFIFGIILDLNQDGNTYLHIPLSTDSDYLETLNSTKT